MAFTPYYPGGWQSGEEGGTPITPAALNNYDDYLETTYTQAETNVAISQAIADKALSIILGNNRNTWDAVYENLDKLPTYHAAVFHCDPNPAKVISNNNSAIGPSSLRGVVARGATGEFKFMCMAVTGATLFAWSITNADTTPTFGSIYRYSGTVVT